MEAVNAIIITLPSMWNCAVYNRHSQRTILEYPANVRWMRLIYVYCLRMYEVFHMPVVCLHNTITIEMCALLLYI